MGKAAGAKAKAGARVNRKANAMAPMPAEEMTNGPTISGVAMMTGGTVVMRAAVVPAPVPPGTTRLVGKEVAKDEAAVKGGHNEDGDLQR